MSPIIYGGGGSSGGGSLANPITVPVNIATTDPNVQPLKVTLPTGFFNGSSFVPFSIVDEHGTTLLEMEADGSVTFSPAAGQSPIFEVANNGQGGFVITPGADNAGELAVNLNAATGRAATLSLSDANGGVGHVFESGNGAVAGSAQIVAQPTGTLGFFGAMPAVQPAAPVTLGDVIAALQTLGLVAT